jgi:hypothetical protein
MPPKIEQLQLYKWCTVHTNIDDWYMGKVDYCRFIETRFSIILKPLLTVKQVKTDRVGESPWKVTKKRDSYLFIFEGYTITEYKNNHGEITEIVVVTTDHTTITLSLDPTHENTIKALIDETLIDT